jgi:adenylylsulfate kinase-like enzyme
MMEAVGEITGPAPALRARLRHVCWIGGGSGAGKSTVARRIADRLGLQVYARSTSRGPIPSRRQ